MMLNYWIYDTNNYTIYSGNQSWTSTSYNSNYTWSVPGLSIGNYTFHAELYANGTFVDSDSDGIMVIANNSGGGNTTGGGNNSSTNGDAHCLTLDNLTISSTYYVSIDLVNICNTSINYPGINASADHSGVSGFYNQTNWWYVIGANDSYTLNAQLAFDTWILKCATNNSWNVSPNSSDFGNMSLQFTYVNTTTNTNICGTDPSLTDLFVSIDNSDWTSIPSIVEGNYYVNCTVIGTHYWLEATIWSGSVNTSYFSTSWQENDTYESISEYWLNLSAGTHCVNVTLWDITGGSQNYVDNEYPCFTLASSSGNNTGGNNTGGNTGGNNSMGGNNSGGNTGGSNSTTLDPCGLNSSYTVLMSWSDAQTYNYGEDQNMSFYVNCTRIGESYTLEYFVYDITAPSNVAASGTYSWMATNIWEGWNDVVTGLLPGDYCVDTDLYQANIYLTSGYSFTPHCFDVTGVSVNSPPTLTQTLQALVAYADDPLNCYDNGMVYSDPNNDPDQSIITWFVNNAQVATGVQALLPAGTVSVGDQLSCEATAHDGFIAGNTLTRSYYVLPANNTAPSVSAITISPTSPEETDTLTCTYTYTDPENDPDASIVIWSINGVATTTQGTTLSSGYSTADFVTCSVTAYDGSYAGNTGTGTVLIMSPGGGSTPTIGVIGTLAVLSVAFILISRKELED